MKIAVVLPRGSLFDVGKINSMERVALTLNHWSRFSADIRFVCEDGAANPAAPDQTLFVPSGLGKRGHTAAVVAALEAFQPDVIEYHQQLAGAADIARRLPGRVHVLYRHTRFKPASNLIDRWRYHARLKAFDRLIFVSRAAREEFLRDYPGFGAAAVVICNPIDVEVWRGDAGQRENLIFFSGRTLEEKGVDSFCAALADTLDQAPDWRGALMLGEWERNRDWAEPHLLALDRFGDRVEIHKSASPDQVIAVARRAAIAVVPSRVTEALGLTALEAHAAGAALISSGRGGLREASGPHALYVDEVTPASLTDAMETLVLDPERRTAMARAGQRYVLSNHLPERRSRDLDTLRLRLLAMRKPVLVPA